MPNHLTTQSNSGNRVTYFRPRRPGPEARIEDAVADRLDDLFDSQKRPYWTAGSLPVGAGMPDLAIMFYEPEVVALAKLDAKIETVLGFVREVGRARADTIASRLRTPKVRILKCLDLLVEARVLRPHASSFAVSSTWRRILPEIVTVEAKVGNWQSAVAQAARNRIFAHRSFVALPQRLATRVKVDPAFGALGLGILSVDDQQRVSIIRAARRRSPRVWTYYYQLASIVARHIDRGDHAISRSD